MSYLLDLTNFAILLGWGCTSWSTPSGCTLPPPAVTVHFGERLANMDGALHPRRRILLSDRATRDLDARGWLSSDTDASVLSVIDGKWDEAGAPPSNLLSEAGVLSMATLIGEGHTALLGRVISPGEAVDWASHIPAYTAKCGTGAVYRHNWNAQKVQSLNSQS